MRSFYSTARSNTSPKAYWQTLSEQPIQYTRPMSLVCIITALPAESRVFIDALKLRHETVRGLRLYASEQYLLLQTGIGKLRAAAATAALLQARPDVIALINAGIAGGANDIGTVHLAHRIQDAATGMQWFPHLPPQRTVSGLPTASIHSVDQPVTDYEEGILFDMEAAGIASAASAYLSTDAIQSVKVISDNHQQGLTEINTEQVMMLMQGCLPVVRQLSDWHRSCHDCKPDTRQAEFICQQITDKLRHSVNDVHQLRQLMQQHLTLIGKAPDTDTLATLGSARHIRAHLQQCVKSAPLRYEDHYGD